MASFEQQVHATPNLLAHWRLGEAGTVFGDDAGSHNATSVSGTVTREQTPWVGDGDLATRFTGGHAVIPHTDALRLNGSFSIGVLVKVDTYGTGFPGLVRKGPGNASDTGWLVYYTPTDRVIRFKRDAVVGANVNALMGLAGSWTFVMVTYDGASLRFYVNGTEFLIGSASYTTATEVNDLWIGRGDDLNSDHTIDEVVLYTRSLTQQEITDLFNAIPNAGGPVGTDPASQNLSIQNNGQSGSTLNWTATKTQSWLNLTPTSGSIAQGSSQQVTVQPVTGTLAAGTYNDTITISDTNASNSPQTASVQFVVDPSSIVRRFEIREAGIWVPYASEHRESSAWVEREAEQLIIP